MTAALLDRPTGTPPRTVRASALRGGDTLVAGGQRVRLAAVFHTGEHALLYPAGMPGTEWPVAHDETVTVA